MSHTMTYIPSYSADSRWARSRAVARVTAYVFSLSLLSGLTACAESTGQGAEPEQASDRLEPTDPVSSMKLEIVAAYPHDRGAFTQGLLWHDGHLFESTGGYGQSTLRKVDLEQGIVLDRADLPRSLFGEGLARVDDRLVQLTWQQGIAAVWDLESFEVLDELSYGGEGWGLCFDGEYLVMSDGTDTLFFRDPDTLVEERRIQVTLEGRPLHRINELECVDGAVWANVWTTDSIVEIDPVNGRVGSSVDASGLLKGSDRSRAGVLNGIAYREERGTFLITGKNWPKLFEVRFVPRP